MVQPGKVSGLQRGKIPSGQIQTRDDGQMFRRHVGAIRDVRDRFHNPVPDGERPSAEIGCRGQDGGRHAIGIAVVRLDRTHLVPDLLGRVAGRTHAAEDA